MEGKEKKKVIGISKTKEDQEKKEKEERKGKKHKHLLELGSVLEVTDATARDLSGESNILEVRREDVLGGVLSDSTTGLNRASSDDDNVLSAELLLELVDKTRLDLAEDREELEGGSNDDGALSLSNLDLGGTADVGRDEGREVGDVLELEEGGLNGKLEVCGRVSGRLVKLLASGKNEGSLGLLMF